MSDHDLAQAVDDAGECAERSISDLERLAERLRAESGIDWHVNYLPLEFPPDVRGEIVGTWPDGSPMLVFTHWVRPEGQG